MKTWQDLSDQYLEVPMGVWRGPIPVPDIDSESYWTGLRDGMLMILRCAGCRYWIHPPLAGCPRCLSPDVTPQQVSGRGVIYSFTIVNREFSPGIAPPYIAALVDLEEQEGLRLVTMIVNTYVRDVQIGIPVHANIRNITDDTALAFFEPESNPAI